MEIYLPIAEMSVDLFTILLLGGLTGILSGMVGVGGGFLMTPMLIFIGVPPAISVATAANQIVASSVSGFLAHLRRGNVDFKMGAMLLAGGIAGSSLGVAIFNLLKATGDIDLVISLCYVVFLGIVGGLMAVDSARVLLKFPPKNTPANAPVGWRQRMLVRLPWKTDFPKSKLYISRWLPVGIGAFVGIMVSLMGIGGGFFLIPAMIYLIGMPTSVVIGTSLFQIIFITANVTFLQAITSHTVDIVLAFLLLSGSVIGAQIGTKLSGRLPGEWLRGILSLLVLGMALRLAYGLFAVPAELYSITVEQP